MNLSDRFFNNRYGDIDEGPDQGGPTELFDQQLNIFEDQNSDHACGEELDSVKDLLRYANPVAT
jgi:hypothetical protein